MKICPPNVTNEKCGYRCWINYDFNSTGFEYTFKGEKFQILGMYDYKHRKFRDSLDDIIMEEINQKWHYREDLIVQYTSPHLQYGSTPYQAHHTVFLPNQQS